MLAQRLRHRVTIEQVTETRDEWGGVVESWATFADKVPAEVVPLSGREFIAAQAERAGVTTRITIRYLPSVDEGMRIVFSGRAYNIKSALPDPTARRHLTLMVEAGVRVEPPSVVDGIFDELGNWLTTEAGEIIIQG